MAIELSYIYYSIILLIVLIVFGFLLGITKGRVALKKLLIITVPIFLLTQLYFWNNNVNDYVKSFLFNSDVYNCHFLEWNLGDKLDDNNERITIPLPKRTVFNFKYDGCSENYVTYTDANEFQSFYDKELQKLKSSGEINDFNIMKEVKRSADYEAFGYEVEHANGKIEIKLYVKEGTDKAEMSIAFNPQQ